MYCIKCGKKIGDGNNFCTECGAERYSRRIIVPTSYAQTDAEAGYASTGNEHMHYPAYTYAGYGQTGEVEQTRSDDAPVEFGIGVKIYAWLYIVYNAIMAWLTFIGTTLTQRSFDTSALFTLSGLLSLAVCVLYALLLKYRTRVLVYIIAARYIIGAIIAIASGLDVALTFLTIAPEFIIMFFVLKKYWPHMK